MAFPRMNKSRLLVLANFLSELKETKTEHFNMGGWGVKELAEVEQKDQKINLNACHGVFKVEKEFECHTTACALGWAAQMPYFNKKGLTVGWGRGAFKDGVPVEPDTEYSARISLKGHGEIGEINIAEQFFGLTYDEAMFVFGDQGPHETPKQAAKVIRALVAGNYPHFRDSDF